MLTGVLLCTVLLIENRNTLIKQSTSLCILEINTITMLFAKAIVELYFPVKPYIKEICSVINLISLTTG